MDVIQAAELLSEYGRFGHEVECRALAVAREDTRHAEEKEHAHERDASHVVFGAPPVKVVALEQEQSREIETELPMSLKNPFRGSRHTLRVSRG